MDNAYTISENEFRKLAQSDNSTYPDEQLCKDYLSLEFSYNAQEFACKALVLLSFVAILRPHLILRLLKKPLGALYALGIDTSRETFEFARYYFDKDTSWKHEIDQNCYKWLIYDFRNYDEEIEIVYAEIAKEVL